MAWFKKKIDWSKFQIKEEPKVVEDTRQIQYPYEEKMYRSNPRSRNIDFTLTRTATNSGTHTWPLESMQVAVLMDLRDKFDQLIDRFDTLVEALNSQAEPDKIDE